MTTNISSDGNVTSICCYRNESDPETMCLSSLLPRNYVFCPRNKTCYCYIFSDPINGTESLLNAARTYFDQLLKTIYEYEGVTATNAIGSTVSTSDLLYAIAMLISLPFLIATFVIYTILPELNNVHGFILRTYLMSCTGMYITIIAIFLNWSIACKPATGITVHFAILAMFFWMNVMSFDIWWTFRVLTQNKTQSSRKKKIVYSLYAWGSTLLIIAIGLITEFVPHLPDGLIKPGLGAVGCWLGVFEAQVVYAGIPILITLISNIFFFASAAIIIFRQKNDSAQQLGGSDSRRHNDEKDSSEFVRRQNMVTIIAIRCTTCLLIKLWFYIYLKLFILTGMMWISEVIWMVWMNYEGSITYILNLPHLLQGPIIFKVFVWNDRIKRLLSARLGLQDRSIRQWIGLTATRARTLTRQQRV